MKLTEKIRENLTEHPVRTVATVGTAAAIGIGLVMGVKALARRNHTESDEELVARMEKVSRHDFGDDAR